MYRKHLLLLRYILLNVIALGVLGVIIAEGWVGRILAVDVTHFCIGIFLVFLAGFVLCTAHVLRTSRDINAAHVLGASNHDKSADTKLVSCEAAKYVLSIENLDSGARANAAGALRHELFSRITHIRHISSTLVVLGLIGTVIGFIIALSGVDANSATDPSSVSPMVATLIRGMSVALYTTLVGATLSVWLAGCYQVLSTGTTRLFTAIVRLGEGMELER